MDKDALRKQLTDELESEFEARLKQAKRQKEQAEEELESASERWRAEKRRLNAEIDKLEGALAEAKSQRKHPGAPGSKTGGIDAVAAAEGKLRKANQEWETERARLNSQINRLEGAVADTIARSNNPMRATQSIKEQFEIQLDKVSKEKTATEQAFLRGKTEWEQERLKMTGEMVKLRRAAQIMGKPVPREDAPEINPKVRDVENRLKESLAKWNAERERLVGEIQKLEAAARQWDSERRQLNDHAGQLQQAFVQAQAKIQSYEVAARTSEQQESKLEEIKRQKEALERELQDVRNDGNAERHRLSAQVERMEQQIQRMSETSEHVSNENVDRLRKQYEQRLQEAIHQKTQLAQELQSASALLETERARLSTEIAKSKKGGGRLDEDAIAAEVARVEAVIHEIAALIDDPDTELAIVIRKNVERAELDAYLKGILFSLGRSRGL